MTSWITKRQESPVAMSTGDGRKATLMTRSHPRLGHMEYVASLPPASTLRTPLHFTDEELSLLAGTNLHGATLDRRAQLEKEHQAIQQVLNFEGFTW
jgi:hypothetical protein